MNPGSIGFAASHSLISKTIRWITRSEWSHIFIVIGEIDSVTLVSEADWKGVQVARFDKYIKHGHRVEVWLPSPDATQDAIDSSIRESLRTLEGGYGYLQIIGLIPVLLFRRFLGLRIPNLFRGGSICSEHALRSLRLLDVKGQWKSMDRNATNPEDIHVLLTGRGFVKNGD